MYLNLAKAKSAQKNIKMPKTADGTLVTTGYKILTPTIAEERKKMEGIFN